MSKLTSTILCTFILLTCALTSLGQEAQQPEFTMPCSQVLKLGLDKFTDVYGEKTQDYSTYGMKQA